MFSPITVFSRRMYAFTSRTSNVRIAAHRSDSRNDLHVISHAKAWRKPSNTCASVSRAALALGTLLWVQTGLWFKTHVYELLTKGYTLTVIPDCQGVIIFFYN